MTAAPPGGEYVKVVPTDYHVCRPDPPPLGAGVGSIWRCECGREFKLTQLYGDPTNNGLASYTWHPIRPAARRWWRRKAAS